MNPQQRILIRLFAEFTLPELTSLRLVCRSWNEAYLGALLERTRCLTINISCGHPVIAINPSQHIRDCEHFFVDDILEAQQQNLPEVLGELIQLDAGFLRSLTSFARQFFTGHFTELIIYCSQCSTCELEQHLIWFFKDLLVHSPNLSRLSLWLLLAPSAAQDVPVRLSLGQLVEELRRNDAHMLQLDFNFICTSMFYFSRTSWAPLKYLTRLTLGDLSLTDSAIRQHSLQRNRALTNLKLVWLPNQTVAQLRQFLLHFATPSETRPAPALTSLSLANFSIGAIGALCGHFPSIRELKLMVQPYLTGVTEVNFTQDLVQAISHLTHLTSLTLINYQLMPDQDHENIEPLRSVTHLTLTNSELLLKHFFAEGDDPRFIKLTRTLFGQFPALRVVTLVGPVPRLFEVRRALNRALRGRLETLHLFFGHAD